MTQTPNTPAGATPANEAPQNSDGATPEELTWDNWLAKQPEDQRDAINGLADKRNAGWKTALESERQQRKDLEKQVRDLAKNAEAGSKAQQDLTALADQLTTAERRADFYEAAAKPEIGLVGVKAAWTLMNAEAERYFDRKGNPNFDLLKTEHPYLFGQKKPTPTGNQGNGTNGQPPATSTMNDWMRASVKRNNL